MHALVDNLGVAASDKGVQHGGCRASPGFQVFDGGAGAEGEVHGLPIALAPGVDDEVQTAHGGGDSDLQLRVEGYPADAAPCCLLSCLRCSFRCDRSQSATGYGRQLRYGVISTAGCRWYYVLLLPAACCYCTQHSLLQPAAVSIEDRATSYGFCSVYPTIFETFRSHDSRCCFPC